MPQSFTLLPTWLFLLICRKILCGWCNEAVEGRIRVIPHGQRSNAWPVSHHFPFTLVHDCHWSDGRVWVGKWKERHMKASSNSSKGGRERRTERTLHRTKCAMVVFHATSMWHMPHVFVRVGNIVRPTWHERSWLCACNDLYV